MITKTIDLINKQEIYITKVKGQLEIALEEVFWKKTPICIHTHVSSIDHKINKISELNEKIRNRLEKIILNNIINEANENENNSTI
jgi:predicted GTPase